MTELEKTAVALERMAEIEKEILKMREYQKSCIAACDNVMTKAWADNIRELKVECARLDAQCRYMKFSVFAQVVKTILTKEEYNSCWDMVDHLILARENVL